MARDKSVPDNKSDRRAEIGLFGGLFNPPHLGHLVGAQEVFYHLKLDSIMFIPTFEPPHRNSPQVSPEHRLKMCELAIKANQNFNLSRIEFERSGPSYTWDTLEKLQSKRSEINFYLIVGADELVSFEKWRNWKKILESVQLIGLNRPGFKFERVPNKIRQRTHLVEIPALNISSRELRHRIKTGQNVRYLIPDPVLAYINRHNLYQRN